MSCHGLNKELCQAWSANKSSKEKEMVGPVIVFCARNTNPFMINRFLITGGSISKRLGLNSVMVPLLPPLRGEICITVKCIHYTHNNNCVIAFNHFSKTPSQGARR